MWTGILAMMMALPVIPMDPQLGANSFTYTSTKRSDCRLVEQGPHSEIYQCPGFGGYGIRIEEHGHGSILSVTRGRQVLVEGPTMHWGEVSNKVAEWRHRRGPAGQEVYALIFRMYCKGKICPDGPGGLYVARLTGGRACLIGTTTSNKRARVIADDMRRPCMER